MSAIEVVTVVVPARNEEQSLKRCLDSIAAARRQVEVMRGAGAPRIQVVLIADSCTDGTATIAAAERDVLVEIVDFASVGAARGHGVLVALGMGDAVPRAQWIANTDADSVVPVNWLVHQLDHADAGVDLVIGTVRPDPSGMTVEQQREWDSTRTPGRPNGHVHGANLGIRATSYLRAGGFRDQREHEDNDLVARVVRSGALSVASDVAEVETSSRRYGRTPGGYAGYLRALDARAHAARTASEGPSSPAAETVVVPMVDLV